MKRQKILAAVIVVFVLFVFTSLAYSAYSQNQGTGVPFRQLLERIEALEEDVEFLMSVNGIEGIFIPEGYGYFELINVGRYYFSHAVLAYPGEEENGNGGEEENGNGVYSFSAIIASDDMNLSYMLSGADMPTGTGNAIWMSLYFPFDALEFALGSYPYYPENEEAVPSWEDFWLITDFTDDEENTKYYMSNAGTIYVSKTGNRVRLDFSDFILVEEDTTNEFNGYGFFEFEVPTP
ncbi:hypothetical protein ES705_25108 [subsurface metagenome]